MTVVKDAFPWHGICGTYYDCLFTPASMRPNAVSRHNKFLLLCIVFCGAMVAPGHDARAFALGLGDTRDLGFLLPGTQRKSSDQDKGIYVNHLLGMALGAIDIANGQVYFRSNHDFKCLPSAVLAGNGGGRIISLRGDGLYTYLFATYKGYGSEVWYVGNLSGLIRIPFLAGGGSLTGWTLFRTSTIGVPDGGVTVMLLGVALGVLALARRFLIR